MAAVPTGRTPERWQRAWPRTPLVMPDLVVIPAVRSRPNFGEARQPVALAGRIPTSRRLVVRPAAQRRPLCRVVLRLGVPTPGGVLDALCLAAPAAGGAPVLGWWGMDVAEEPG